MPWGGPLNAPLPNLRVVVTRPPSRARSWVEGFDRAGAEVIALPVFRLEPVAREVESEVLAALATLRARPRPWVAFTSVPGVEFLVRILEARNRRDLLDPPVRVAGVGDATAAAIETAGFPAVLKPDVATGTALAEAIVTVERTPAVAHPTSNAGRTDLEEAIRHGGGEAFRIECYRQVACPIDGARLLPRAAASTPPRTLVTFASPSAAERLLAALPPDEARALVELPAVAVGATTGRALTRLGFGNVTVASSPRFEDVLAAAIRCFR